MTAALLSGPALEPVALADAKAFLKVDGDSDDELIGAAITAARIQVEAATRRALISQTWRIYRDDWPEDRVVPLGPAPLIAVDGVTVYDADGEPAELPATAYEVDLVSVPGRLVLAPGAMAPSREVNGIEIDVTAGYGTTSVDVPAPLRQAILMLLAHWYEHRSAVGYDRPGTIMPLGADALIAPYRVLSL